MNLDTNSNPVFNESDIFELLYCDEQSLIQQLPIAYTQSILDFANDSGLSLTEYKPSNLSKVDFDAERCSNWFIPDEYVSFDIFGYCIDKCSTDEQRERVCIEYLKFESVGLVMLLRWCMYFVDTCTANKIVWGVGRGSSVASYVLYLIGVHRVDSLRYNLNFSEFLIGE